MFRYTSATLSCPVCSRKDGDCRISDRGLIHCRHSEPWAQTPGLSHLGRGDSIGCEIFRLDPLSLNGPPIDLESLMHGREIVARPGAAANEVRTTSAEEFAQTKISSREMTPALRQIFGKKLGLPPSFLTQVHTRFYRGKWILKNEPCILYDARSGDGEVVGCKMRSLAGVKRSLITAGLIIPDNLDTTAGPIYCVEGYTDTIVLAALGLGVVGRDSNRGGVADLAKIANRYPARQLIIVGENDGRTKVVEGIEKFEWPGREGAEHVAKGVADLIKRPVFVVMPPKDAKDVRDWFHRSFNANPGVCVPEPTIDERVRLADEIVAALTSTRTTTMPASSPTDRQVGPQAETIAGTDPFLASIMSDPFFLVPGEAGPEIAFARIDQNIERGYSPQCGSPTRLWQERASHGEARVLTVSCGKLFCPQCSVYKREHYVYSARHHFHAHASKVQASPLFLCQVPRDNLAAVKTSLRKQRKLAAASYLSIDPHDGGPVLLVATRRPYGLDDGQVQEFAIGFGDNVEANLQAIDKLRQLSEAVAAAVARISSAAYNERPFAASRDWALVEETSPKSQWETVGRCNAGEEAILAILQTYDVTPKYTENGPFWSRRKAILWPTLKIPDFSVFRTECDEGQRDFDVTIVPSGRARSPAAAAAADFCMAAAP